jgi:hypothetical protein
MSGFASARGHTPMKQRQQNQKSYSKEVHEDSHLLEYIGLTHVFNLVNDDDPMLGKVTDALDKIGDAWNLDDSTLRIVIRELLVSRLAESSFWRFPLQTALYALNLGEAQSILRPMPVKKQGSPVNLLIWKTRALCHVHFKVGQGVKKYVALETDRLVKALKLFEVGKSHC